MWLNLTYYPYEARADADLQH